MLLIAYALCSSAVAKELWTYGCGVHSPLYCEVDGVNGKYLYVCRRGGGLDVLKIGKSGYMPVSMIGVSQFDGLECVNVTQVGTKLYLAVGNFFERSGKAGLVIVEAKDPTRPRIIGSWISDKPMRGSHHVAVSGKYAYLSAMNFGVVVLDVSDPAKVKYVSTYQPDIHFPRKNPNKISHPNARHSLVRGEHLFVAYDAGGIRVLDISNPKKLKEVGRYINSKMSHKNQAYNELYIDGDILYAAVDYAGLEVLQLDGIKMKQVGWWNPWGAETGKNIWFNSPGHTNQISFDKSAKRVYLSAGDMEVVGLDVSQPSTPKQVWGFGGQKDGKGAWGARFHKGVIYATYIQTVVPFQSKVSAVKAIEVK